MKKVLKITGIVLLSLLVLLAVLPLAFKGKIKKLAVDKGNEMIDARFDFGDLGVSLLRDFPRVSVTLKDFYIAGIDRFEGDTLVRAGKLGVSFNLASLFGDGGYEITRVTLKDIALKAIVLEDGKANWDIMKDSGDTTQTAQEEPSDMKIKLKSLSIDNLAAIYDDRQGKTYAELHNLAATMSGDLAASRSTLKLEAKTDGVAVRNGGIPYLSGGAVYAKMDVDADLEKNYFALKDNIFRLNAIEAALEGWLALREDDGMDMNLKFSTPKIDFKQILSLIPAVYAKDFESIKATGEVSLDGWAKGTLAGEQVPAFDLAINVAGGTFRYPELPKGVDNIDIAARLSNPGGNADQTIVNVDPLSFSIANNPFTVKAVIATPVSDMAFDIAALGTLDLGMVKEVYPLDSMELNGVVKADVKMSGHMSDIEKELYDRITAMGSVHLSNMVLKSSGMPDVKINKSALAFSPRYMELNQTDIAIGRNDIAVEGRVENYIAYALKDATLKGTAKVSSTYFNANDFLSDSSTETTADTTSLSVIKVPGNLDLALSASMDKLIYDNIEIDGFTGQITVKEGRAELKNLAMNTLGGKVKLDGSYSTAGTAAPQFKAALAMDALSFADVFSSFVTIQKIVPLFQNLNGNFSGKMDFSAQLDEHMSPVLSTINGQGSLSTKDISLSEVGVIGKIAELAQLGGITDRKVKDLKLDFAINEGKIATKPFDIRIGETAITLSGTSSLDSSLDYTGDVKLPPNMAALARVSSVPVKIGGTFTQPKVTMDMHETTTKIMQGFLNEGVEEAGKKLGVDLADAEKQKQALVDAAKRSGEVTMQETRKQADALVTKAGDNPLAKLAAQKAADKLVAEAQARVDALVARATAQGDSIISKAAGK